MPDRSSMQKGTFDDVAPDVHGLISKQTVELDGVSVTRVRFEAGARRSSDLEEYAGTHSCELPHVAVVEQGALHVEFTRGADIYA